MIFEYGEDADASRGCGATLMGEMWYFGGAGSQGRQVRIVLIVRLFIILFRLVKSKVANWSDTKICHLISWKVHATRSSNQLHEFFSVLIIMISMFVIRKC